jgi:hypothetical protein
MDDISRQMGWNVLAMDATANWDGLVGSDKVFNNAIVVYPQSTPSPYEDTSRRMVSLAQGVMWACSEFDLQPKSETNKGHAWAHVACLPGSMLYCCPEAWP